MGLDFSKFEWTPNTVGKNWMQVCNYYGNMMPFLSQTLWQVGPMPWISQSCFPSYNWGNYGDQFSSSYTPGAGGGGGSTNLTETEKETLKTQKKEIKDYAEKYNNIREALKAYEDSLSDDTLSDFESEIGTEGLKLDTEYKVDNIDSNNNLTQVDTKHKDAKAKYEAILEIYNNYNENDAVEKAYKESILEDMNLTKATNTKYNDNVTNVSNWINNPTGQCSLLEEHDGNCTWPDDVDVMELLSTWNSTQGNTSHLIQTIVTKYNEEGLNQENKGYLETFTEKLCDQLRDRAKSIDTKNLSESTKKLLNDAKTAFPNSISSTNITKNLATNFDELYKAIRLAEAEIADKELEEAFDFLGNDNPYKKDENKNKYFNEAETDLAKEKFNVNNVTPPPADQGAEPPTGGTEGLNNNDNTTLTANKDVWHNKQITFKVGEKEYPYTIQFDENNEIKFKADSGGALTVKDLESLKITDIKLNDDGSYSYKTNNAEKKFNKNGNEITS